MAVEEPTWTSELLASPHAAPGKGRRVRRMFNDIAPRYELVNSLFSAGRDSSWRRTAAELVDVGADDDVLDIACGTGDFARTFASAGARTVVGCDFAHEMLARAVGSHPRLRSGDAARDVRQPCLRWCEADALRLPFRSGSFSITSCAFGVRNFEVLDAGLSEMFRVLRPGGRAVILEFARPRNRLARALYELYATRFMPIAATLISGDRSGAYRYLPSSVVSFLDAEQMGMRLCRAGFRRATATPLTMGVVNVHVALRD